MSVGHQCQNCFGREYIAVPEASAAVVVARVASANIALLLHLMALVAVTNAAAVHLV